MKLSRRAFLVSGTAVGGGFLVGWLIAPREGANLQPDPEAARLNAFIKITEDDRIILVSPQAEMGQGINTALAMLVAEELSVPVQQIEIEEAPVDAIYANTTVAGLAMEPTPLPQTVKNFGYWALGTIAKMANIQITGGSTSVRNFYQPLREAGASAREGLIEVALRRWNAVREECQIMDGTVVHRPSGRSFTYGALAADAARRGPVKNAPLMPRRDWSVIGQSVNRLDIPDKVTGQAEFGIDVRLPSMLYATMKSAPSFGGKLLSADATRARSMPGVVEVITTDNAVAVVGDSYWRAKKALDAIDINFSTGEGARSTEQIEAEFETALAREEGLVYEDAGDAPALINATPAAEVLDVVYRVPYLAHATMEPQNATAYVSEGKCHIWAPTQVAALVRRNAARMLDMDEESVTVHTTYLGGGFGRRLEVDLPLHAVALAMQVGRPVKLIWSREEDTAQDAYRPGAMARWRGILGDGGLPRAIAMKSVSQSASGSYMDRNMPGLEAHEPDTTSVEGSAWTEYAIPARHIEHVMKKWPIPVGFWRSVGNSHNAFFKESFIDELAHAAGQDPVEYRRALLGDHPRHRAVLDAVVEKAGDAPDGAGQGRGVALHKSFGTIVGQVVDVTVTDNRLSVDRVTCVVDCGDVVNPDTVRAQIEGGIIFGLSAALYGEITLTDGAVDQSNFHDYQMVTMANAPEIRTHLLLSGEALGGVGEPGTPPIAPALANAIFNATGRRFRSLPLSRQGLSV